MVTGLEDSDPQLSVFCPLRHMQPQALLSSVRYGEQSQVMIPRFS